MSLILVATSVVCSSNVCGCSPDGRVGVRRGGAMDTGGDGERAAHRRVRQTMMPDPWRRAVASSRLLGRVIRLRGGAGVLARVGGHQEAAPAVVAAAVPLHDA